MSSVLPRQSVEAATLSQLFVGLLSGLSIKGAVERLRTPVALETFYHLLARLRRRMDAVRVMLLRETGPPDCNHVDALWQTMAHLNAACSGGGSSGMCAWFQIRFQRAFLG